MLLEITDVSAERNAVNLRHCRGRLVLNQNESLPDWASNLGITTDCLGLWMDMIVVVSASSVTDGSGLLGVDLHNWWMSMNFRREELNETSFEIIGGTSILPLHYALTVA